MYANGDGGHLSNAVFLCVRATPHFNLNTRSFRRKLLAIVEDFADEGPPEGPPGRDSTDRLNDSVIAAENYAVHFLSPKNLAEGQRPCSLYGFRGFEGVFVLRNFLTPEQCLLLACETLRSYINPPSNSNLRVRDPNIAAPLWPSESFKALRWSTIGHLYDWGKRQYVGQSHFPEVIVAIVDEVNRLLSNFYPPFTADAAIINFYSKGYFLRLHRDDAEETDDPVVNISLGAPAIFCICKEDPNLFPLSVVVDSGSVVVMSKNSRRSLHGISKLLHYIKPDSNDMSPEAPTDTERPFAEPYFIADFLQCPDDVFDGFTTQLDAEKVEAVREYLSESRISISVRKAKV